MFDRNQSSSIALSLLLDSSPGILFAMCSSLERLACSLAVACVEVFPPARVSGWKGLGVNLK